MGVITPSLNQGHYLAANIESLLGQGVNAKHVIIDGGSTDETLDVLQSYSQNIACWVSEKDSGQSQAINKGLRLLDCDFITWLNSDDYYLPNALMGACLLLRENPDLDVVFGSAQLVDSQNNIIGIDHGQKYGQPYRFYSGMCFPQPSSIIRSSTLSLVGELSESLHYAMDYELFLRIKLLGGCFHRFDFPLAAYRLHSSSKTVSSPISFADEWLQVYNNFVHDEPSAYKIINALKALGFYRAQTKTYERHHHLDSHSLEMTFYYSLHYQAFFRYQAKQYDEARRISLYMLKYKPFNRLMPPILRLWLSSLIKK